MVKLWGKEKEKKASPRTLANGRIVVTDFRKLKKEDFPNFEDGDIFFLSYDGRVFFDSEEGANEALIILLELLTQRSRADLREWERVCRKKFPNVKTAEDLAKHKGNPEDFMKALSALLVPLEVKRREFERAYYGGFSG